MSPKKKYLTIIVVGGFITIALVGVASRSLQLSPSPTRDFTASDLLINLDVMPEGWEVELLSTDKSPEDIGFRNNLGGSIIELRISTSSAEHIVARFYNAQAARQAYTDHDLTRNTEGKYAATNEPFTDFPYRSPIADQFRLTCITIKNTPKIGESCAIEAQYKEFLSTLLYDTTNAELAIPELEVIARAIDLQLSKYFGDK